MGNSYFGHLQPRVAGISWLRWKGSWHGKHDGRWWRDTLRSSTHQVRSIHIGFTLLDISPADIQVDPCRTTDARTLTSPLFHISSHRGPRCRYIPAAWQRRLWSRGRHADSWVVESTVPSDTTPLFQPCLLMQAPRCNRKKTIKKYYTTSGLFLSLKKAWLHVRSNQPCWTLCTQKKLANLHQ